MGFGSQHRHTFASENALPSVAIRLLAIQHLPASGLGVDLEFKKNQALKTVDFESVASTWVPRVGKQVLRVSGYSDLRAVSFAVS